MPNEAPYGHGCPPEPVTGKSSKYRTFGPEKREAGGWAVRPGDAVHQRGQQLSGLRPGPMQGEVSPYDPLFSAHPASSSQRQSLCGTQNNPPRSDLLKYPNLLYRSGARFCSKGRRITLLSGAARMPIKRKSAQPYFKANSHKDVKSQITNHKSQITNHKSQIRKLI